MPTYEYRCTKCEQHLEVFQSFSESPLTKHEGCGGKLVKVLSPAGIVLKGSGFYKTDSRSGSGSSSSGGSSSGGSSSKGDTSTSTSSDGASSGSGSSSDAKAPASSGSGSGS